MSDSPARRLYWSVVDALGYLVALTTLRILDVFAGPEPETPADEQRKRDREQLERALPMLDCKEPSAAISHCADRHRRDD